MGQFRVRLAVVSVLLALSMLVVGGKLFKIQVIDGKRYALRSQEQVQAPRSINAKRGDIYDRSGKQLATSVRGRMALDLNVLGVEGGDGKAVLQRVYPMGDVGGPVIGHVGREGYGLGGVEYTFDHYLRGEDGMEMVHKKTFRKIGQPIKDPRDGCDVYLTIDLNLQKIVQAALKQAVADLGAKGAMCIVMDPHTGKILAMANEPSFNPNVATSLSSEELKKMMKNRCVSEVYEPGSTFKVMTAAMALQEKVLNEEDLLNGNNGVYEIHGEVIRDVAPQGEITFTRALAVSSNVCFAQVASGFKNDLFYRYIRDFGFGAKTGTAFQGEEEGILHPVRSWSGRTRVTMAMGHEISATFLQMMMAFASAVNGGVLLSPIICERVERKNGTTVLSAEIKPVRRVVSEETSVRLRRMMKEVVEGGTGKQAAVPGIAVAGKTGTSRKPEAGGYSLTRHWSSFIGFIPVETPALLCGVVIDEPSGGTGGGAAAAPVFKKIVSQALAHPELEFSNKILIRHQAPAAGTVTGNKPGEPVLFAEEREFGAGDTVQIVPNCVGKDLRDAFNLMNSKGIPVYAVGSGIVKRQSIVPGEILKAEKVCTLYSSVKK